MVVLWSANQFHFMVTGYQYINPSIMVNDLVICKLLSVKLGLGVALWWANLAHIQNVGTKCQRPSFSQVLSKTSQQGVRQ